MGTVTERNLYAYNQATGEPIPATYTNKHNTLGFALNTSKTGALTINHSPLTIIIDPSLAWGTYFGGVSEDVAQSIVCDNIGNVIMGGLTYSLDNIATAGAYQTTYHGNGDAFIAKFSTSGSLLWATYYGGDGQDLVSGIVSDSLANLFITGYTLSTTNIATPGSHQTISGGNYDGFLAKFNSSGAIQWGTFFGGEISTSSSTRGSGLAFDNSGYIYICGSTGCNTNIATIGSYQDTLGGTRSKSFLAKFDESGLLIWSTYFGLPTGASSAVSCFCDKNHNVFIGGGTYDTGIITTAGCFKSDPGHGDHCFITKFDSSCHLLWSSYFGGDSVDDLYGIVGDNDLNVYISGFTNSANGIATSGAYQTENGGGYEDAFLAKFNDTGALKWATYYGGSGDDEEQGIAFDNSGNIYITGATTSTSNISTPHSFQNSNMGYLDCFLSKFSAVGSLIWATYYGGTWDDVALSVSTDYIGNVYMAGYTASPSNIGTAGSYQPAYADSFDAFIAKFDTATTTAVHTISKTLNNIQLFPNPNGGNFTVSGMVSGARDEVMMEITDAAGRVLQTVHVPVKNNTFTRQVALNGAASGIYYVKVLLGSDCEVIKFTLE